MSHTQAPPRGSFFIRKNLQSTRFAVCCSITFFRGIQILSFDSTQFMLVNSILDPSSIKTQQATIKNVFFCSLSLFPYWDTTKGKSYQGSFLTIEFGHFQAIFMKKSEFGQELEVKCRKSLV